MHTSCLISIFNKKKHACACAAGFRCECDADTQWVVNTDTGLCTTYACESSNDICMNEAQCSADMDDPLNEESLCQCRNYNLDENCEVRKYTMYYL